MPQCCQKIVIQLEFKANRWYKNVLVFTYSPCCVIRGVLWHSLTVHRPLHAICVNDVDPVLPFTISLVGDRKQRWLKISLSHICGMKMHMHHMACKCIHNKQHEYPCDIQSFSHCRNSVPFPKCKVKLRTHSTWASKYFVPSKYT